MAAHYVAYIEHVITRQRKYINTSELLEVEDTPNLRCWHYVLDKKKKQLFIPNKEYGKVEKGKVVRYYVLLIEESKEKVQAAKGDKRIKAPPTRLSIGPAEHPLSAYEMVEETLESQADKAVLSRTGKRKRDLEESNASYKTFKERQSNQKGILQKSDDTADLSGTSIPDMNSEANPQDNLETCLSDEENVPENNNPGAKFGRNSVPITLKSTAVPLKTSECAGFSRKNEPHPADADIIACLDCQVKDTLLSAKHDQLQAAVSEVEALRLENEDMKKELQNIKDLKESELVALRLENADLKQALEAAKSSGSTLAKLQDDINKLPDKIRNASTQNCWVSTVPKYAVELESQFQDLEVSDNEVYFGNGKKVRRELLAQCDYPSTVRGRVKEIVKQLYGSDSYMFSNSGKRSNDMLGHVPVRRFPKVHFGAIDVVLRSMPWDGLDEEKNKLKHSNIKEGVRKFTYDECEAFLQQKKPKVWEAMKKARKDERKKKSKAQGKDGKDMDDDDKDDEDQNDEDKDVEHKDDEKNDEEGNGKENNDNLLDKSIDESFNAEGDTF